MMIFNCKCSTIFSSSDKTKAAVIAVEMHIAHAIMLFSSLEAVKAGKEKAIQIRRGEKGGFLFYYYSVCLLHPSYYGCQKRIS